MSNMLTNFAAKKTAYQAYTLQHGIERIKIQIPLKNVCEFEVEFNTAISEGNDSKADLLRIMDSHGGNIRLKLRD